MRPKLVFLIRDLGYGGAQRQLIALASGLGRGFDITVLHFYHGPLEKELQAAGVHTVCIGKTSRWDMVGFFIRLVRTIRNLQPDILHGYLAESNLLTVLLKPFLSSTRVVWGVRDSKTDAALHGLLGRCSFGLGCALSSFANLIIANSRSGADYYVSKGFPKDKIVVVPNGIDVERFQPDRAAGAPLRSEWGFGPDHKVFGLVGRLSPMKDHATFIAAAVLAGQNPDARFICIGDGDAAYKAQMQKLAKSVGLGDKLVWSDARQDMHAVYNALDCLVSSSAFGEGFSNVIGEAMACGVPCIATNVGDSAWLIGDTGFTVPAGEATSLAQAFDRFVKLSADARAELGLKARTRIAEHFTTAQMIRRTHDLCLAAGAWPAAATKPRNQHA